MAKKPEGKQYRKVSQIIWKSKRFLNLSDQGKLLQFYLMTCLGQNATGLVYKPDGHIISDLGWDQQTLSRVRDELLKNDLIVYDEISDDYYICRHFKHNSPDNDSVITSIQTLLDYNYSEGPAKDRAEEEFEEAKQIKFEARQNRQKASTVQTGCRQGVESVNAYRDRDRDIYGDRDGD